jgi:hypothetical protein
MFARKLMIALCAAVASAALAQTTAPQKAPAAQPAPTAAAAQGVPEGGVPSYIRPETPQQRKERLGTPEDPGTNPDPAKQYWRFGHFFHIEKFDRRWANYDDVEVGFVRPFAFVNVQKEVYQQNEKYVWVWMQDLSAEELAEMTTPKPTTRYPEKSIQYFKSMRGEFFETTPKQNDIVVRFEESSSGLPTSGSWRNSATVADMNGDGCPDIIAPPERAGGNFPAIFLGDCKGHWTYWAAAKWPRSVDYGSVVAADFNKDGKMDLAFGVHLTGVYVFLGDGKGNFTEVTNGLPTTGFPTRRVVIADVDGDGYPDIVGIGEGPTSPRQRSDAKDSRLQVFFNRDKGKRWEATEVVGRDVPVGGDWLAVGNFNGDKTLDLAAASIFFGGTSTLLLSSGPKAWKPSYTEGTVVPGLGYYFANTVGKFSSPKRDDAIVSYLRFWPNDLPDEIVPTPPAMTVGGIDRVSFTGKEAKRTPIVRWSGSNGVWGMGSGDFDHDGKLDFIYTRYDPREAVLMLGDGKGGFTRAKVEGITLAPNTNYDLLVADVNKDGLPDVIVMYEASSKTAFAARDGSIHVFLNRGASKIDATQKTTSK